jgi:DNA polymerase-3 subunit epsilon
MMKHRPIVFVDVETTGLSAQDGHILEIGAVRVENNKVVAEMKQLLDPGVDVPWYITKLTSITNDEIKGKPQFREVSDEFEHIMEGALFAAHNVDFDYGFFKSEFKRLGQTLAYDRFCTAKLSRRLYPQARRHNLDSIIKRGGYEVTNRHRAYDDAYVLYQFYLDALTLYGLDIYNHIDKLIIASRRTPRQSIEYVPFFD